MGTARAVSQLDPLSVDPADIAVQLTPPVGMAVQDGSAVLRLSAQRGDATRGTDVTLQRDGNVWTIPVADHARLRAGQVAIAAGKEADEGTKGSLGVTLDPCRMGAGPLGKTGSVAIRLSRDGDFLPLLTDAPAQAMLGDTDPADLPMCTS